MRRCQSNRRPSPSQPLRSLSRPEPKPSSEIWAIRRPEEAGTNEITVEFDPDADAAYVRLNDGRYARTEELDDYRNIDYDADGGAIGVEFLYVSDGIDLSDVSQAARVAEALKPLHLTVLA